MSLGSPAGFWQRYRRPLVISGVIGWAVFLAFAYNRMKNPEGTSKGAEELLEIGALPVT